MISNSLQFDAADNMDRSKNLAQICLANFQTFKFSKTLSWIMEPRYFFLTWYLQLLNTARNENIAFVLGTTCLANSKYNKVVNLPLLPVAA